MEAKKLIESGKGVIGIEFGSTRIKAVLINEKHEPVISGDYEWENRLEGGYWTYHQDEIWTGLRGCYRSLADNIKKEYGVTLTRAAAIGFSAMMHGYLAFDKEDRLLVPFRTWRNATTADAAAKLTELFQYNVPMRWSIAHLYQAILNGEEHVKDIAYVGTLAAYIHWQLTGQKVLGIGDASGMFPIDPKTKDYYEDMVCKFDNLIADKNYPWKLRDIFPKVLLAGEDAGVLTEAGARLLDESGNLEAGIPVCPPEGDAGTGMVATNSVAKRTGNVSAGTSIFAMVVLEKELKNLHTEIDMVTTPDGSSVAMAHANNCTSDLNAWVHIFREFAESFGIDADMDRLYKMLYNKALEGDADCGGVLSYGFLSGEPSLGVYEGRPMVVRTPESNFNLANLMRSQLFVSLATMKYGMDILQKEEGVQIDSMLGHGGLFKTKGVGQKILAAAIDTPVAVMETAGEGGPWGQAILASYLVNREDGEGLEDFLNHKVFAGAKKEVAQPDPKDVEGFEAYMKKFLAFIPAQKAAIEALK